MELGSFSLLPQTYVIGEYAKMWDLSPAMIYLEQRIGLLIDYFYCFR